MTVNRHRTDALDRLSARGGRIRDALAILREAIGEGDRTIIEAADSRRKPPLAAGGLVLLTEDDRGVARAVAADLRALGYSVARVRHGVGKAGVEGANLTSSAAVAALVDRLRGREPLAAIVHLAPIGRPEPDAHGPSSWDTPDDARALALLAQASAEDLMRSASRGGSCLIVARRTGDRDGGGERLDRWIEISSRSLAGVRVRPVVWSAEAEIEVFAAEVVRAVLGTEDRLCGPEPDPASRTTAGTPSTSEVVLLGAPDRASWIQLAAALADWLDEAKDASLLDVAWTLHRGQPEFPFRVGVVARSAGDLSGRLRGVVSRLSDPNCLAIFDPLGAYWVGDSPSEAGPRSDRAWRLGGRLGRFSTAWSRSSSPVVQGMAEVPSYPDWSGREWLNHLVASRFASGHRIRPERLLRGRPARIIDFGSTHSPTVPDASEATHDDPTWPESVVDVLDEVLDLHRRAILTQLSAMIEA